MIGRGGLFPKIMKSELKLVIFGDLEGAGSLGMHLRVGLNLLFEK